MPGPLDFLSDASAPQTATPAISETPPSAITVESQTLAPEGPARGPDGKFVAKPADAPSDPTPAPAVVASAAPDPASLQPAAPSGPTFEERLAAMERENAGLRTALTQTRQTARQKREAPPLPEVWDENDRAFFDQEVGARTFETAQEYQTRLANQSFTFAEREFGKETTDAARAWASQRCRLDPTFNQQLLESDHPAEIAVRAYQQDQILQRLSDPAKAARLMALMDADSNLAPAPSPGQPAPQPVAPPRSLASAPSATGGVAHTPSGPGRSYDAIFQG